MAQTVDTVFFSTTSYGYPTSTAALYQVGPDGTIEALVAAGAFVEFWGAGAAGDTVYFQGVSAKGGPGLYELNDDGTIVYTGLYGDIDYSFGDLLYVEGYDWSLWTIDAAGTQVDLGISNASTFFEYGDSLYFQGLDTGSGQYAVFEAGADGSLSTLSYEGEALYGYSPIELNETLYFSASTASGAPGVFEVGADGELTKLNVAAILDAVPGLSGVVTAVNDIWYFEITAQTGPNNVYQTSLVSYNGSTEEVSVYGIYGYEYIGVGDDVYVYTSYKEGLFKADAEGNLTEIALPAGIESYNITELVEFNDELVFVAYTAGAPGYSAFHVSGDGTVEEIDVPDDVAIYDLVETDGSLFAAATGALVEIRDDWSVVVTSYDPYSVGIVGVA